MSVLNEARDLGVQCAWLDNGEMATGVVGSRENAMRRVACDRLNDIFDVMGEKAVNAFSEGYDATIDFSLNTEWRMSR